MGRYKSTVQVLLELGPPGTGDYLISFLNVLPVALPATKTTSYPTKRTSEKSLEQELNRWKL